MIRILLTTIFLSLMPLSITIAKQTSKNVTDQYWVLNLVEIYKKVCNDEANYSLNRSPPVLDELIRKMRRFHLLLTEDKTRISKLAKIKKWSKSEFEKLKADIDELPSIIFNCERSPQAKNFQQFNADAMFIIHELE